MINGSSGTVRRIRVNVRNVRTYVRLYRTLRTSAVPYHIRPFRDTYVHTVRTGRGVRRLGSMLCLAQVPHRLVISKAPSNTTRVSLLQIVQDFGCAALPHKKCASSSLLPPIITIVYSIIIKSLCPMSEASDSPNPVNLDELRDEINHLSDEIRALKTGLSPEAEKSNIEIKVNAMVECKRKFAQHNGGIGFDGKPWEEPLSKSEKKRRDKAMKHADGVPGETNAVSAEKAAKKGEKKAAKLAKKAAHKSGTAAPAAEKETTGTNGEAKPAVVASAPPSYKTSTKVEASAPIAITAASTASLRPYEVAFSPNVPITHRPVTTLTIAVLLNVAPDLTILSDHKRINPALGTETGTDIVTDSAMARYLLSKAPNESQSMATQLMGGSCPSLQGQVHAWVDYAHSMMMMVQNQHQQQQSEVALLTTLQRALASKTYLVGHALTMADIAMYQCLGWTENSYSDSNTTTPAIARWANMMKAHPAIREATSIVVGVAGNAEASFAGANEELPPLVEGMNYLQGAISGSVCTRFPPEPSGYLHIGHAKAMLLNDYYATRYKGRLILRFDDTNPSKEKEEYQTAIVQDLAKLGVQPSVVTYTSDYFRTTRGYAVKLIQEGKAFMDDTPQDIMQAERMERKESKHRNQSPQEAMKYFELMCSGSEKGAKWCLRAKIDMNSHNGTMRDPVLYRQNLTPHHNSGTTYKAYPTYDLACPLVDAIEGVSHALRTTEYNDRDEQYAWLQHALGLRRVRIHSFARMNFRFTELSKRKLTWFVEHGLVTGWDDPRFPTVRGVLRRGVNMDALRKFILKQGASRRMVNMEWGKFWAENKNEIDGLAKRFMAIDAKDHVVLKVTNGPAAVEYAYLTTDYFPKDPSKGKRCVRLAQEILLEKIDTEGVVVGETIVLMRWGVVKLTKIDGDCLEGEFVPDGDIKASKRKLSWLSAVKENTKTLVFEFDNLISKEKLEEDDDFKDFINPNTMAETEVIGDAELKMLQKNEIIQLERRGYFRVDRPYICDAKPLLLFMIPDGKAKAMSGLSGKLAHR